MLSSDGRGGLAIVLTVLVTLSACSTSSEPTTTVDRSITSTTVAATTHAPAVTSTTTAAPVSAATMPFDVPLGIDGLTYDTDGSPPSGPSSFAVLSDGSVVVADTMAVGRGEPRLLHYDRSGELLASIDLADEQVASVVDVVTDGSKLAILDVLVSMNRYRVLTLGVDGDVAVTIEIPPGFHFEDGLTGLAWDDDGILLEFEFGSRYVRVTDDGAIESVMVPTFDGISVELIPGAGRMTEVVTSGASFTIERVTDVGGVTLIGIGPHGSIVVVVDEVDTSGPSFIVTRRIQRYSATGQFEAEGIIDAADQFIEVPRPFELDATGQVMYLRTRPDGVTIAPVGV